MRKLVISTYVTLDGVIEAPQDWPFDYGDEEQGALAAELLFAADALLIGRGTYESFAASWPSREGEFADYINRMRKHVVSTTLKEPLDWSNSTLLEGDVVDEVRRLKDQPGQNIIVFGSGRLAHTLVQANLVDEHLLWIHPFVRGYGERLFAGATDAEVGTLTDVRRFPAGVVVHTYGPSGT